MWWEIRGKRDGKQIRYQVEAMTEVGAETLARWKGIEVAVVLPQKGDAAPRTVSEPSEVLGEDFSLTVMDQDNVM